MQPQIHIIRHGQSLHNIDRNYAHRDSPLTQAGEKASKEIRLPITPDLIAISPMTRAIQTAKNAFPSVFDVTSSKVKVQIWIDLREAHDAECNKGLGPDEISAKFPELDFSECPKLWDTLPPHSIANATIRAERVRRRLEELSQKHQNIVFVSHRGFIAFLVQGGRHDVCERRSYHLATDREVVIASVRMAVNIDAGSALAEEFHQRECNIFAVVRNPAKAKSLVDGGIEVIDLDVLPDASIREAVNHVHERQEELWTF